MINISEEEKELYRYRNMLFELYWAFKRYRECLAKCGIDDPEGWEMDKDLDMVIRLEDRIVDNNMSVRAINVLRSHGCYKLMDVVQLTEKTLKETPACGKKTLNEIKDLLAQYGLELGMDVSKYKSVNYIASLSQKLLIKK
jgi:DNA-directed RNA polymerase alpha subunit